MSAARKAIVVAVGYSPAGRRLVDDSVAVIVEPVAADLGLPRHFDVADRLVPRRVAGGVADHLDVAAQTDAAHLVEVQRLAIGDAQRLLVGIFAAPADFDRTGELPKRKAPVVLVEVAIAVIVGLIAELVDAERRVPLHVAVQLALGIVVEVRGVALHDRRLTGADGTALIELEILRLAHRRLGGGEVIGVGGDLGEGIERQRLVAFALRRGAAVVLVGVAVAVIVKGITRFRARRAAGLARVTEAVGQPPFTAEARAVAIGRVARGEVIFDDAGANVVLVDLGQAHAAVGHAAPAHEIPHRGAGLAAKPDEGPPRAHTLDVEADDALEVGREIDDVLLDAIDVDLEPCSGLFAAHASVEVDRRLGVFDAKGMKDRQIETLDDLFGGTRRRPERTFAEAETRGDIGVRVGIEGRDPHLDDRLTRPAGSHQPHPALDEDRGVAHGVVGAIGHVEVSLEEPPLPARLDAQLLVALRCHHRCEGRGIGRDAAHHERFGALRDAAVDGYIILDAIDARPAWVGGHADPVETQLTVGAVLFGLAGWQLGHFIA